MSPDAASRPATITWTVRNAGTGAPRDTFWVDEVYLSRSADRDNYSRKAAARSHVGTLGAGGTYTQSAEFYTPIYESGSYYLIVATDTRDDIHETGAEENNRLIIPVTIVQPPPADLVVASVTVPDTAVVGDNVLVRWTLRNQGTNAANGWVSNGIYFSKDAEWDLRDALLGVDIRQIQLPPNTSQEFTATLNLAQSIAVDSAGALQARLPGLSPGSYLRLRTFQLGYTVPAGLLQKTRAISTLRVYVAAQNLFTISKYKFYNPEVVGPDGTFGRGIDDGSYPGSRVITGGLQVSF